MPDGLYNAAHIEAAPRADALDALLSELISHPPEIRLSLDARSLVADDHSAPPVTETGPETPSFETSTGATERPGTDELPAEDDKKPARTYSFADLELFERLTGYRLVAQRQLWRSVDKEGNRSMAADRLFTVLAEEAFQMADRHRRNGPTPLADLSLGDIAAALKPMRAIAAHLGERGLQASDRLEAIVLAALTRRKAA